MSMNITYLWLENVGTFKYEWRWKECYFWSETLKPSYKYLIYTIWNEIFPIIGWEQPSYALFKTLQNKFKLKIEFFKYVD